MKSIMLYLALSCGPVTSNLDLISNKIDKQVFERAQHVCKTVYKSCLKSVQKDDKGNYKVMCGNG